VLERVRSGVVFPEPMTNPGRDGDNSQCFGKGEGIGKGKKKGGPGIEEE